jgi:hypothetical protein
MLLHSSACLKASAVAATPARGKKFPSKKNFFHFFHKASLGRDLADHVSSGGEAPCRNQFAGSANDEFSASHTVGAQRGENGLAFSRWRVIGDDDLELHY